RLKMACSRIHSPAAPGRAAPSMDRLRPALRAELNNKGPATAMPDEPPTPPAGDPTPPGDQTPGNKPPFSDAPVVQPYSHQPVSARVPERVARGVYSAGQIILDSPKEFVIDFLQ